LRLLQRWRAAQLNATNINSFLEVGLSERILLIGLALCFRPGDRALSIEQIIAKKFAPSEELCRDVIAFLIRKRLVIANLHRLAYANNFNGRTKSNTLLLSLPRHLHSHYLKSYSAVNLLKTLDSTHTRELEELLLIILAGECVDYSLYLAEGLCIELQNPTIHDEKLHLLLLSNTRGQVLKLIWQAINTLANFQMKLRKLKFADLIDNCYSSYNRYLANHYQLETYNWPKSVKHSYLSNFVIRDVLKHRGQDIGIANVEFFTKTH
jgi:hypothetical protein